MTRTLLVLLVLAGVLPAQETPKKNLPAIPLGEYQARRARIMETFSEGIVVLDAGVLLAGASGIDANTPVFDFSYLTGIHDDKGILVMIPAEKDAFLFIGGDVRAAREKTGIKNVLAADRFPAFAEKVLASLPLFFTKVRRNTKDILQRIAPDADFKTGVDREVTRRRLIKSEAEILMMKKAADATNLAQVAAMKACKAGMNEGALQKLIEDVFKEQGCDGLSFPSIVGSGKNGTILHYMDNKMAMPANSLVVCDIGASYRGYTTDITRTLPTSGRFSDAQRAAYQCVLDAQRAAEDILEPGATFGQLTAAANKVFEERKLTDWSYAHSRESSVRHGLGHYVGLAVHDSGTYNERFEPGMVITIEPGYYSKKDEWGIRIEDIYIITETGFDRLSAAAPREVAEIEKLMKK